MPDPAAPTAPRPRVAVFIDGAALDEACARIGESVVSVIDLELFAAAMARRLGRLTAIHLIPRGRTAARRSYQRLVAGQGIRIEAEGEGDPAASILVAHLAGAFDLPLLFTDGIPPLLARSPLLRDLKRPRHRAGLRLHVHTPPGTIPDLSAPWPLVDLGGIKPGLLRRSRVALLTSRGERSGPHIISPRSGPLSQPGW